MIHVYTDGSFFEGFGGWAAVFLRDDGSVWKELSGGIRNADSSNNRAELAAVIEALDFVLALKAPGRSIELCIHTDSQYVQRIATGEYQRAANLDLWADFDELAAQVTLTWEWIPGHTGEPMNERADALAGAARQKAETKALLFGKAAPGPRAKAAAEDTAEMSDAINEAIDNPGTWVPFTCPNGHVARDGGMVAGCKYDAAKKRIGFNCYGEPGNSGEKCDHEELYKLALDAGLLKELTVMTRYEYRDENSNLLFYVLRIEEPGQPKAIRYLGPNGRGGKGVMRGVRRVLYRLPELLKAAPDAEIWILEGEKDVDAAVADGLVATTNPGGAKNKWRAEYNAHLAGHVVRIVADRDERGRQHALDIYESLIASGHPDELIGIGHMPDGAKDYVAWKEQNRGNTET